MGPKVDLFLGERTMFYGKMLSLVAVVALLFTTTVTFANPSEKPISDKKNARILTPLNIAILIQDDLISQVGNELDVTRDFIRSLPAGSRVMTGYITSGSLQVRQPFTTDLDRAARSLRIPMASGAASPFNPYVEVIEALRRFDAGWKGTNALLLISDGLDT
jgi:hypothetical protein